MNEDVSTRGGILGQMLTKPKREEMNTSYRQPVDNPNNNGAINNNNNGVGTSQVQATPAPSAPSEKKIEAQAPVTTPLAATPGTNGGTESVKDIDNSDAGSTDTQQTARNIAANAAKSQSTKEELDAPQPKGYQVDAEKLGKQVMNDPNYKVDWNDVGPEAEQRAREERIAAEAAAERSWEAFRQQQDEKARKREALREKILAIGDAGRHIFNLAGTAAGANNMRFNDIFAQMRKEKKEDAALKAKQAEKDRDYALKVNNYLLKQAEFGLKQAKGNREAEEHALKQQKQAQEIKNLLADGKFKEARAKAKQAEADLAPELQKAKLGTQNAKTKKELAAANANNALANKRNRDGGSGGGSGSGNGNGKGKYVTYGGERNNESWDIPAHEKTRIDNELVAVAKKNKWVKPDAFGNMPKDSECLSAAINHIGHKDVQRILKNANGAVKRTAKNDEEDDLVL